jgi:hypothetical protein
MDTTCLRKKGKPLSLEEKWSVVRVFQQCDRERAQSSSVETRDAHSRAAHYTGIGRRQVVEIIRHVRETGTVSPSVAGGNRTGHPTNIPSAVEAEIRQYIFDKHLAGEVCHAPHIQDLLQPLLLRTIPLRTVQTHLERMGFTYSRTRKKTRSLREKPSVRQQRHSYIYHIRAFRRAGYTPVYLDESFLHHYHGCQFSWFSDTAGDYLERPAGKGRRWCFIHAMHPRGLLDNAYYIFEAKRSTGDDHTMFNAPHFQEWWRTHRLPNLPEKSVVVLDRASFHMVPEDPVALTTMKKGDLQAWLTRHHIAWEDHWLKAQFIDCVDAVMDTTPVVQKIAEQQGHKVLFLPVHHPELNPIETIWAIVKNACGKLLRQGIKFQEVRQHLDTAFTAITLQTCQGLYEKIQAQEDTYWQTDIELDSLNGEII